MTETTYEFARMPGDRVFTDMEDGKWMQMYEDGKWVQMYDDGLVYSTVAEGVVIERLFTKVGPLESPPGYGHTNGVWVEVPLDKLLPSTK